MQLVGANLRRMRVLSVGFKLALGLVVGLALAELAFHVRSAGAFPHLNFYEADAELGVRLAPNTQMRLAFSGNPVTTVTTNSQGFRGSEWPVTPQDLHGNRDVLIVGDSQVFGLGVEHAQTFASQLQTALRDGGRVLNAGVPTYGPREYTALVERLTAERKPARVVYVFNMANDLFELERPNRERHAVWDGWAVRSETAPAALLGFPGRRWLMSRSHAVFALRSWLRGLGADDAQFASEGGFHDIAARAASAELAPLTAADSVERLGGERARIADELANTERALIREFSLSTVRDKRYVAAMRELGQFEGDPRDIVQPYFTEAARPVRATAFHLLFTALALDKNAAALEKLARESGHSALLAHIARRRELRAQLSKNAQDQSDRAPRNRLDELLARTQRACDAVQAEMMVVILPLDVQVSEDEWRKYGQAPLDLSATAALNQDVAERARRLGLRVLDATAALRGAEPGAFLQGDLHMSASGHAALARAIAAAWREPVPPPVALPYGRSPLPAADEWRAIEAAVTTGDAPSACSVAHVREWWRVSCRAAHAPPYERVTSIALMRGGHGEVIADYGYDGPTPASLAALSERSEFDPQLIAPVLTGDVLDVQLGWSSLAGDALRPKHSRTLRIEWREGSEPHAQWGPVSPPSTAGWLQPESMRAVIEGVEIPHDQRCRERRSQAYEKAARAGDYEAAHALLADARRADRPPPCQLGKPLDCDPGEIAFGVVGRCVLACSRETRCSQGSCTADRGRFGCIAP